MKVDQGETDAGGGPAARAVTALRPRRTFATMSQSTGFRNVVLIGMLGLYAALQAYGPERILGTQLNDTRTIEELSFRTDEVGFFESYATTAMAYGLFPDPIRNFIVYTIAAIFFTTVLWKCRGLAHSAFGAFLLLSPLYMFLAIFNKETLLVPFLLAAYAAVMLLNRDRWRAFWVAVIYGAYALFFRNYYLLITCAFLFLLALRNMTTGQRIGSIVFVLIAMAFLPRGVYEELNFARDVVNYYRVGYSDAGFRTAFFNYTDRADVIGFFLNYGYAFARLNLPLLFDGGIKELFLMVNVAAYALLIGVDLKFGTPRSRAATLLFVSHLAVLIIFEPDLGSYMRHSSVPLIFLAPALGTLREVFAAQPWRRHRPQRPGHRPLAQPLRVRDFAGRLN